MFECRSLHVRAPFSELVEVPHGLDFVRRDDLRDLLRAVAGPIGRPSGDGAVLVGSQGLGQRVVRSIADQPMAERELLLVAEGGRLVRDHQLLHAQPPKRVAHLRHRSTGQLDQGTHPEHASYNRGVLQHRLLVLREAVEPGRNEPLHRARQVDPGHRSRDLPLRSLGRAENAVVDQLADDLLDVERVALAALDDRSLELRLDGPG